MKLFSKIASIVLALVLMVSAFVMPTSAAGDMQADINLKLSKNAEQSNETYDVYDLTVSVKAGANGIAMLNLPIIYDSTIFTPSSMHKTTYAILYTTAMKGFYNLPAMTKLGELATEEYTFLEDGVTKDYTMAGPIMPASQAKTISSSVALDSNLGTLDRGKYAGVYFMFKYNDATRYIVANNEEVDLVTFHFFTAAGTDVSGAEFGIIGDSTKPQVTFDTSGSTYFKSGYVFETGSSVVTNASYSASSPVYAKTSQIRFNGPESSGTGSANFDVRTRAAMSAADFAAICGADDAAKTAITDIGFVYADSSITFDMNKAKTAVTNKATTDGYVYWPVSHIQKTGTEYVWTCLITSADYAKAVNAVGYITVGGTTYFFDAAYATDFSDLYDTWSSKIPA